MYFEDFCIFHKDDLPNSFIKLSNLLITIDKCNISGNKQLYLSTLYYQMQ